MLLGRLCLRACQAIRNMGAVASANSEVKSLPVQVGRTCRSVRTLIAAKCPGITLNSMHGFPELRHLDLTGCEGIAPGTAVSGYPSDLQC